VLYRMHVVYCINWFVQQLVIITGKTDYKLILSSRFWEWPCDVLSVVYTSWLWW